MIKTEENLKIFTYICVAFLFSIGIRLIWVYQLHGIESFYWNGQLMINTNDGYFFAEGARDILKGFHEANDLSPVDVPASMLTAFFAKILPFSFESIILYMPAFLGSLLVVPMVLLGQVFNDIKIGFIAALLSSIAWSYYNRTMTGYFDTDMLNIVFPSFILLFIILATKTQQKRYILFTCLSVWLYSRWYHGASSLNLAFFALLFLYVLIFQRKNNYFLVFLSAYLLTLIPINFYLQLIMTITLVMTLDKIQAKFLYAILFSSLVLFAIKGGLDPIIYQLKGYVFREETAVLENLKFFSVTQTVREASSIPFGLFANRISGHLATFFISLIGYIYLCYKKPIMLFSLPMLGLGFLAYKSGLRFTVYAVPVLALGFAYLLVSISNFIEDKRFKIAFMSVVSALVLTPNILHIISYQVPSVFNVQEVQVLDKLKKISNRNDYVISWWDYGYPLRYYSDVKTLVDGGKHTGDVNFAPSFILTHDQKEAANLARLEVEYTEKRFKDTNLTGSNLALLMKDYGYKDAHDFLQSLKTDIKLPKKSSDIYIYLPLRMFDIYPTISQFSYIDFKSGKTNIPLFYYTSNPVDVNGFLYLNPKISINKKTLELNYYGYKADIKSIYTLSYNKDKILQKNTQVINPKGNISLVINTLYNAVMICDEKSLNSLAIQQFFFENYDKTLFEPVISSPYAKVYKLKI